MTSPYTEDALCEQPAMELAAELGWETVCALEELFGPVGTLGRDGPSEVVLVPRLRAALEKLNPGLRPEGIHAAVAELTRDRSAMSLVAANQEVYELIKDGVPVKVPDGKHGGTRDARAQVIDWSNPANNDFLSVNQLSVTGPLYTCRPDVVGFVNGLPLVVIEFKKPGVPARQAYEDNLTSYMHPQNGVPALFCYNAFLIASNGTESRIGTITADWERFFEWKRIEREDEPKHVSLEKMIRGTCDPKRLLDLVENFTVFSKLKSGPVKVLAQNHQYLGVKNAIAATLKAREAKSGRAGVFWHTQGAGKSFSMVFFAQMILRRVPGNWTFVVVTDRTELDDQIARTFKACGAVSEHDDAHATSSAHLRQLLSENHRYVFTLIHKFQTPEVLCNRHDVIVMSDEAHRSQYDTLALNMRTALPNALFMAFTGTPLIAGEERTREVFGDYISIYDFQQSVEDGATVPLYYENRTPELKLKNPGLNDEMYAIIENAELDPEQEDRLEKVLSKQYHILTREDRLDSIAKDIVKHFLGRGFTGKAMVVSIDKATALKMHDKVRSCFAEEKKRIDRQMQAELRSADDASQQLVDLTQRLKLVRESDMALIVSPGQNEIEQMKKLGLDIVPHRKRMNDEDLGERFKDPKDPLRIVFLCAMWLTGFDAPSCSTVYLDKPMRNHTLMQTIARANRVFPGKHSGIIVDYANVFASLEKALAIYGKGTGGTTPVRDKKKLLEELEKAVAAAVKFCAENGVDIPAIGNASGMSRLSMIAEAVERLISPDPLRKEFLGAERLVSTLYTAVKPDPAVSQFAPPASCLSAIALAIRECTSGGPVDISGVMGEINALLDRSIEAEGFRIGERGGSTSRIDLSRIDFEKLQKQFKASKRKNFEIEALKAAIRARLETMVRANKTRADYLAKFEELIESYNSGSRNIESLLEELIALSRSLNEEQTRHVRENMSEEELVVFDILTRPAPELSPEEREEVKKAARNLLGRVRELLVLDWRLRAQSRARIRLAIEEELDSGLPRAYTPDIYTQKCARVFEHVFETYGERQMYV